MTVRYGTRRSRVLQYRLFLQKKKKYRGAGWVFMSILQSFVQNPTRIVFDPLFIYVHSSTTNKSQHLAGQRYPTPRV